MEMVKHVKCLNQVYSRNPKIKTRTLTCQLKNMCNILKLKKITKLSSLRMSTRYFSDSFSTFM